MGSKAHKGALVKRVTSVRRGAKVHRMSLDKCDVLDRLEEAVVMKTAVRVTLRDGRTFVDRVNEVVTKDGHDYGVFAQSGQLDVATMTDCERADG